MMLCCGLLLLVQTMYYLANPETGRKVGGWGWEVVSHTIGLDPLAPQLAVPVATELLAAYELKVTR
jgi:hypothetical protein